MLPSTVEWLQFSLPWSVCFNVLNFRAMAASVLLCSALVVRNLRMASTLPSQYRLGGRWCEGRRRYLVKRNGLNHLMPIAMIVMIGLARENDLLGKRLLLFAMIVLVGAGLAKTGSRTPLSLW